MENSYKLLTTIPEYDEIIRETRPLTPRQLKRRAVYSRALAEALSGRESFGAAIALRASYKRWRTNGGGVDTFLNKSYAQLQEIDSLARGDLPRGRNLSISDSLRKLGKYLHDGRFKVGTEITASVVDAAKQLGLMQDPYLTESGKLILSKDRAQVWAQRYVTSHRASAEVLEAYLEPIMETAIRHPAFGDILSSFLFGQGLSQWTLDAPVEKVLALSGLGDDARMKRLLGIPDDLPEADLRDMLGGLTTDFNRLRQEIERREADEHERWRDAERVRVIRRDIHDLGAAFGLAGNLVGLSDPKAAAVINAFGQSLTAILDAKVAYDLGEIGMTALVGASVTGVLGVVTVVQTMKQQSFEQAVMKQLEALSEQIQELRKDVQELRRESMDNFRRLDRALSNLAVIVQRDLNIILTDVRRNKTLLEEVERRVVDLSWQLVSLQDTVVRAVVDTTKIPVLGALFSCVNERTARGTLLTFDDYNEQCPKHIVEWATVGAIEIARTESTLHDYTKLSPLGRLSGERGNPEFAVRANAAPDASLWSTLSNRYLDIASLWTEYHLGWGEACYLDGKRVDCEKRRTQADIETLLATGQLIADAQSAIFFSRTATFDNDIRNFPRYDNRDQPFLLPDNVRCDFLRSLMSHLNNRISDFRAAVTKTYRDLAKERLHGYDPLWHWTIGAGEPIHGVYDVPVPPPKSIFGTPDVGSHTLQIDSPFFSLPYNDNGTWVRNRVGEELKKHVKDQKLFPSEARACRDTQGRIKGTTNLRVEVPESIVEHLPEELLVVADVLPFHACYEIESLERWVNRTWQPVADLEDLRKVPEVVVRTEMNVRVYQAAGPAAKPDFGLTFSVSLDNPELEAIDFDKKFGKAVTAEVFDTVREYLCVDDDPQWDGKCTGDYSGRMRTQGNRTIGPKALDILRKRCHQIIDAVQNRMLESGTPLADALRLLREEMDYISGLVRHGAMPDSFDLDGPDPFGLVKRLMAWLNDEPLMDSLDKARHASELECGSVMPNVCSRTLYPGGLGDTPSLYNLHLKAHNLFLSLAWQLCDIEDQRESRNVPVAVVVRPVRETLDRLRQQKIPYDIDAAPLSP